jgi:hypothetical protein
LGKGISGEEGRLAGGYLQRSILLPARATDHQKEQAMFFLIIVALAILYLWAKSKWKDQKADYG